MDNNTRDWRQLRQLERSNSEQRTSFHNDQVSSERKDEHPKNVDDKDSYTFDVSINNDKERLEIDDNIDSCFELLPGVCADHFKYFLDESASGKYGCVRHALDKDTGKVVALKRLFNKPSVAGAGRIRDMVEFGRTEAKNWPTTLVRYQRAVRFRDARVEDKYAIVMDFIDGTPLHQYKRQEDDDISLLQVLTDLSDALFFLHSHHRVHRDIRASNILIGQEHAYLVDVDLACAPETSPELCRTLPISVLATAPDAFTFYKFNYVPSSPSPPLNFPTTVTTLTTNLYSPSSPSLQSDDDSFTPALPPPLPVPIPPLPVTQENDDTKTTRSRRNSNACATTSSRGSGSDRSLNGFECLAASDIWALGSTLLTFFADFNEQVTLSALKSAQRSIELSSSAEASLSASFDAAHSLEEKMHEAADARLDQNSTLLHLIKAMVSSEPRARPRAAELCKRCSLLGTKKWLRRSREQGGTSNNNKNNNNNNNDKESNKESNSAMSRSSSGSGLGISTSTSFPVRTKWEQVLDKSRELRRHVSLSCLSLSSSSTSPQSSSSSSLLLRTTTMPVPSCLSCTSSSSSFSTPNKNNNNEKNNKEKNNMNTAMEMEEDDETIFPMNLADV